MESEKKPTLTFTYPGGEPICLKGKFTAASWAQDILNGSLDPNELADRARSGEFTATTKDGRVHGRYNLIALIVASHGISGDLEKYVNENGEFIFSKKGAIENVNSPKNKNLILR